MGTPQGYLSKGRGMSFFCSPMSLLGLLKAYVCDLTPFDLISRIYELL